MEKTPEKKRNLIEALDDGAFAFCYKLEMKWSWIAPVNRFITHFGNYGFIFVITGMFIAYYYSYQIGYTILISLLLGLLITNCLLKNVCKRRRPYDKDGEKYMQYWENTRAGVQIGTSFPSGHATVASCFGFAMFMVFPMQWSWVFILFAILVCASRVFLFVHYFSDVFVGLLIGIMCSGLSYFICMSGLIFAFPN